MKHYSLTYFIGQSFKGLWRNGVMSFASITVLMSCLIVLGGFSLLVYNIDVNLEKLGLLNEISVFLELDLEEEEIVSIENQLKSIPDVTKVIRTTNEEGLEQVENSMNLDVSEILDDYNPLSEKFTVYYSDNPQNVSYEINQIEGVRKVYDRLDLAMQLESFKNGIIIVFIWFLAILLIVSLFVIINTIKLAVYSRRHEITVMRYVGATGWFITLPFVFEGIIIGIISSVLGFFIEWYAYTYIEKMVTTQMKMINVIMFDDIKLFVFIGFVGIGILTGIIGSCLSLSKYLKS